jgi:DnaJ-class molecular chaperone
MLPGDLVFKLVTLPHKKFARNGDDLEYFMTISLLEALVGFRTEITHLDGHKVPVARDEITPPGFVLSIPGEGMPHHNTPSVKVPSQSSPEQRVLTARVCRATCMSSSPSNSPHRSPRTSRISSVQSLARSNSHSFFKEPVFRSLVQGAHRVMI